LTKIVEGARAIALKIASHGSPAVKKLPIFENDGSFACHVATPASAVDWSD
jgi:hypothetical protein